MWASRQTTERSFLHAEAHGPVPRRQTTGSHATAPAVFGPWGRFSKVRVGTTRVASPAFETPRRSAPVFADASGAAGRRAIRARNLTSHRSSLRRPRGAASYAPNLSLHTPPLRAGTHDCTTHRCCNGRQPQTIPAPEIQHAQAAVAARARGAGGGARLATTARRRAALSGRAHGSVGRAACRPGHGNTSGVVSKSGSSRSVGS